MVKNMKYFHLKIKPLYHLYKWHGYKGLCQSLYIVKKMAPEKSTGVS